MVRINWFGDLKSESISQIWQQGSSGESTGLYPWIDTSDCEDGAVFKDHGTSSGFPEGGWATIYPVCLEVTTERGLIFLSRLL
jgi:hypothetical protein